MTSSIPVFRPRGELTADVVRDVLTMAGRNVPEAVIARWTPSELLLACDYAMREYLRASDNSSVRVRPCPWFVAISARPADGEALAEWDAMAARLQGDAAITDREAFIASIATTAITMLRQHLAALGQEAGAGHGTA